MARSDHLVVGRPAPAQMALAAPNRAIPRRDLDKFKLLRGQLSQNVLSLYFRDPSQMHSLGFTSAVPGEGKSFLAMLTARILADERFCPVTLVEFNWETPSLYGHFGFAPSPGIAEWLRGECGESEIRHQVNDTLTVIGAGTGRRDAVMLLAQVRQRGLPYVFGPTSGFVVVDLPAILTSGYGVLAASLVESLAVVVRAGVTPEDAVAETCQKLEELPMNGVIMNQIQSRIPGWIRQLL